MKKVFLSIIALGSLVACQNELYRDNAELHPSEQAVYMPQSSAQVFVESGATQEVRELTLSLVRKPEAAREVQVQAGLQADLDKYNKANGTEYKLLPAELYEAPKSITFAEQSATAVCPIKLKDMAYQAGVDYALPIRITDECAVPGQEVAVLSINQITYTKVARFFGSGTERADMFIPSQTTKQWTMEAMVRRSAYSANNRSIGGTKGNRSSDDEIFTRFGDVTITPPQLQMKTVSANHDVPKDKFTAKPNEWYMLSFVYDGSRVKIYVNGVNVYNNVVSSDIEYAYNGFWLSGSNEFLREFRFYNVARTERQIASSVWKMADYTDPNLVVYYPLNGKKLDRATGQITDDESKIYDWGKGGFHLNMPRDAKFMDDNGKLFVFPLDAK